MIALSVKNITKKFKIYDNSRSRIKEWLSLGMKSCHREVVALKGLSFDVPAGQSLGIIGRNGAGKSTLLKILSGVSSPTEGSVEINGRVSALLELGAGFHPEFSGRDNVYMNAMLLGMDRSYIQDKYDEIVEFSELGRFIDDPVKFYSSGMVVRLGFSVAIHMDPQILIVDEALGVGDIQFQRKCLNAMREFKRRGTTIIIVTHSLSDVGSFCERVLLIEDGEISMDDTTEKVIAKYRELSLAKEDSANMGWSPLTRELKTSEVSKEIVLTEVKFLDADGNEIDKATPGEKLVVRISYDARKPVTNPLFRLEFYNLSGEKIFGTNTYRRGLDLGELHGPGQVEVAFNPFNLNSGRYYISIATAKDEFSSYTAGSAYDAHHMAYHIDVERDFSQGGGNIYCPNEWRKLNPE